MPRGDATRAKRAPRGASRSSRKLERSVDVSRGSWAPPPTRWEIISLCAALFIECLNQLKPVCRRRFVRHAAPPLYRRSIAEGCSERIIPPPSHHHPPFHLPSVQRRLTAFRDLMVLHVAISARRRNGANPAVNGALRCPRRFERSFLRLACISINNAARTFVIYRRIARMSERALDSLRFLRRKRRQPQSRDRFTLWTTTTTRARAFRNPRVTGLSAPLIIDLSRVRPDPASRPRAILISFCSSRRGDRVSKCLC